MVKSSVIESSFFKKLGYSTCYEDVNILKKGLEIHSNNVIFSITSGGDHTLAFLLDDPKKIISLDFNANQNCLLELKMAAFKFFSYNELLAFLGVLPSSNRHEQYKVIRQNLKNETQLYWDKRKPDIIKGVLFAGRQDNYFLLFGKLLKLLLGKNNVQGLLNCNTVDEQKYYYKKNWNNLRWQLFFDFFFGKSVMQIAMAKEHFRFVKDENWGKIFRGRFEDVALERPVKDNYLLHWIINGNYKLPNALPPYLRQENFNIIKERIDRVKLLTGEFEKFITQQKDSTIDRFNLSNMFDWVSDKVFSQLLKEIARVAKPNARFAYWNLLKKHHIKALSDKQLKSEKDLANELLSQDLAFAYTNFEIGQIIKD